MTLFSIDCSNDECGNKLNFSCPEDFDGDWYKVVCSNCCMVNHVSMVRVMEKNV